jgi:hypothetical protein
MPDPSEFEVVARQGHDDVWAYHTPCGTHIIPIEAHDSLGAVLQTLAGHTCATISPVEAMDFAIFAVNNHTDPDASTEEDVAELERKATLTLDALIRIRGFLVASGEDLPDHVFTDDAGVADQSVADVLAPLRKVVGVTTDPARPMEVTRPLSDFAIHFGLIPEPGQDGPASIRVTQGGAFYRVSGADDDQRIEALPGLYVNGDWEQWGEYAVNGTTHLVYDFPANPWTYDFGTLVSGLIDWIKDHKGPGRLSDSAIITDKADHSIAVATVYIGGDDPNLDVVVPRDWRTR